MAKQTVKPKVRKKKWFPVLAPRLFREQVIGEIHLYESGAMKNRNLTVNMMNMTGNPRNQHINVFLRISEVKDGKGMTEILGFEMMPSAVKRVVRRGRTKVSDSVVVLTSDNKRVRIKPLLITNTSANKSITNSIRLLVRNTLLAFVNKLTYERLIEEIMSFKLQKHLGNTAAKIAPIRNSEIRSFKLIEKEGVAVLKPAKMKKEVRKKYEEEKPREEKSKADKKEEAGEEEKGEKKEEKKESKAEEKKESKKAEAKQQKSAKLDFAGSTNQDLLKAKLSGTPKS